MSLVSNLTPDDFVKAWIIGNNETVASAGASSVFVYIIFDINIFWIVRKSNIENGNKIKE